MPDQCVPNEGELEQVQAIVDNPLSGSRLLLFNADHEPMPEDVLADYEAIEADFAGYVQESLTWGPAVADELNGWAFSLCEPILYSPGPSTPQTIYGYAVVSVTDKVQTARRWPAADRKVISAAGGPEFVVQVKYTLQARTDVVPGA
jgi:hypothetical protein